MQKNRSNKNSPSRNALKGEVVEVREFRDGYYEHAKVVDKTNFDLGRELVPFFDDGMTARLESGRGVKTADGNVVPETIATKKVARITGLLTPADLLKSSKNDTPAKTEQGVIIRTPGVTPAKKKIVEEPKMTEEPKKIYEENEPQRPYSPPVKERQERQVMKKEHVVQKKNTKKAEIAPKKVAPKKQVASPEIAPKNTVSQSKFAAPSFQASPPPSQLPAPMFLKPQHELATEHLRGLLNLKITA